MPAEVSTDTTRVVHPDTPDGRARLRIRRLTSWMTFGLLFLVMGSAVADGVDLVDIWGVDEKVVDDVGADGARLSVRYTSITRPALASPFEIVVVQPGGFDADVEIAMDLDYLELWDLNGVYPAPSDERSEGERIVWTFAAPEGDTLKVSMDARIEPGVQLETRKGAVSVLDRGSPAMTVRFETKVRP